MTRATTYTCDGCSARASAEEGYRAPGWGSVEVTGGGIRHPVECSFDLCPTCAIRLREAVILTVRGIPKAPIAMPAEGRAVEPGGAS